jgi:hypothetical protein
MLLVLRKCYLNWIGDFVLVWWISGHRSPLHIIWWRARDGDDLIPLRCRLEWIWFFGLFTRRQFVHAGDAWLGRAPGNRLVGMSLCPDEPLRPSPSSLTHLISLPFTPPSFYWKHLSRSTWPQTHSLQESTGSEDGEDRILDSRWKGMKTVFRSSQKVLPPYGHYLVQLVLPVSHVLPVDNLLYLHFWISNKI